MHRKLIIRSLVFLLLTSGFSCFRTREYKAPSTGDHNSDVVIRRRDDGTVSSVNQVNGMGVVNGIRVTFYPDGKTVYSRLTFDQGIKQGPSIWYYKNGQILKHITFKDGERHGPGRKYYSNGFILAEFEYEKGNILPGLKEYQKDGTLVASYPEIQFRETDLLASKNRIDLEIYCADKNRGIKYFLLEHDNDQTGRIYLISEKSAASLQFYVNPGESLNKRIEILAEIPTELGNIMVKKCTYNLSVANR